MASTKTSRRPPNEEEYAIALQTIAPHWYSGPHPPQQKMNAEVRAAYRIVGRYIAANFAPGKGDPHPGKSSLHRLRAFRPETSLPPNMRIVTKVIRTTSKGRARSWTSVWIENRNPSAGVVYRYKHGLTGPRISIRGTTGGRGSRAVAPCNWRSLTRKESRALHPAIAAFLRALSGTA